MSVKSLESHCLIQTDNKIGSAHRSASRSQDWEAVVPGLAHPVQIGDSHSDPAAAEESYSSPYAHLVPEAHSYP